MRKIALDGNGHGRRVVLTTDPTQDTFDRYGRLLAYVRTTTGNQLNLAQVAAGWAKVYVYGGEPFQQTGRFRAAERRGRSRHRGVWARCGGNFTGPPATDAALLLPRGSNRARALLLWTKARASWRLRRTS